MPPRIPRKPTSPIQVEFSKRDRSSDDHLSADNLLHIGVMLGVSNQATGTTVNPDAIDVSRATLRSL